jgi:mRNA-degrading endonuclease RelE of RelBE toxin-antitoxin system
MPWKLSITRPAQRQLRALSDRDRQAVGRELARLEADPGRVDLTKLAGRDEWRMRVGRWRTFFELESGSGTIYVTAVRPRNEGTSR